MDKFILLLFSLLFLSPIKAQVNYTANDQVLPYNGSFRPGLNSGVYAGFTDENLADLAAGNPEIGNKGVGTKALRPGLFESFTYEFGTDIRVPTFQHYYDLDIRDNTVIVGFPATIHQDQNFYCSDVQSQLFANLYEPIWDDGTDGTPYNENNYYAAYLWEVVNSYQDYVKFWEIWNEPGFDYTGNTGFLNPGQTGNWWDNNPEPCDYKLRAPIFHYVRLLRISWEIIKSVDPSAYVVVSGTGYPSFLDAILRNTDNPEDGTVTGEFPLGGGAYFDVFGFHSYPHFDGSLREYSNEIQDFINYRHSDAAAEGFARVRGQYQEVFNTYGYDGQSFPEKLWTITECNVPRVQFGDYIGSTEAQRNFMIKAYVAAVEQNFVQLDIYKIAEDQTDATAFDEFDLMGLYYQLSAQDMYFNAPNEGGIAMGTATKLLYGKNYDADKTAELNLPDFIKGGAFADEFGNYTYVVWAKTQTDQSEDASALYSFPDDWGLQNLIQREWNFGETGITNLTPAQNIPLSGTPIFLTEQAFTADNLTGCAPLQIQFNDLTGSAATNWQWEFAGDGTPTYSNLQNPQLTLFQSGDYTATLQAFNDAGELLSAQTQNIQVFGETTPMFTEEISGPIVNFQNQSSINSSSFLWEFGDGNTSTEVNPMHVYLEAGEYTVTLTTDNQCGSISHEETIHVTVPSIYLTEESANDTVPAFTEEFRAGYNFSYYPNFTDQDVANIAAGNAAEGIKGIGAKSVRTFIGEFFVNFWDYDIRLDAFQHYANLGIENNTMTLDFPSEGSIDSTEFCPGTTSRLFKNLYHEIWDDGSDGTPINEENPYAVYVYNMVQTYGPYVKYWEIVNAPDFDLTGESGYLPPGEPGNWWDNNPEPCDYQLRAPIFYYIRTLRISYEIIKQLQPDDYVAIAGIGFPSFLDAVLRNTDNPADGSIATGYEKSGGAYFDIVGFKSYPHFDGATSYYDTDIGGFAYERHSDAAAQGIELAKSRFEAVLQNYGYGTTYPAKEWIITEANVPRFQFEEFLGGNLVQRNWITKAYIEAAKSGIQQFNIFSLAEREYQGNATTPFDAMGLYKRLNESSVGNEIVNDEGIALRTTSQLLFGRTYNAARTQEMLLPEEVGGAAFEDSAGEFTYVLWAKTDTDNSEANTATYSFPPDFNLDEIFKREWDFGETEAVETIDANNIDLTASPIFISDNPSILQAPLAIFSSDIQSGCPNLAVQFTNTSLGDEATYFWEFPGGVPSTSTELNPVVTYSSAGNFPVSLTVTNNAGSHSTVMPNYIEIIGVPTANFTFTTEGPWATFTNASTGSYYYNWDFGDTGISGGVNPEHFYFANGEYEVRMIAFNDCFSDTITQLVNIGVAPTADFIYEFIGDCDNPILDLTDQSYSSPTIWEWEFPEGNPAIFTGQFPEISYEMGGTYEVTLSVSNEFGTSTKSEFIYVPGDQSIFIERDLCDNQSEEIGGIIFDEDNSTGTLNLQTVTGCDSTLFIDFTFNPTYEIDLIETIPAGETFTVGNSTFIETGEYSTLLFTEDLCDSLVNLSLTVLTNNVNITDNELQLLAVPNPFSDYLNVEINLPYATDADLELTDLHGRKIRTLLHNSNLPSGQTNLRFDLDDVPKGLYFVHLIGEVDIVLKVVKM